MSKLPLGLILYRGPSQLTGAPIVCCLTGIGRRTKNAKTGDMLQSWVLVQDQSPVGAINSGVDAAVCGDCPLRGRIDGNVNRGRACYVRVDAAPRAVWSAWKRGAYVDWDARQHAGLIRGRLLRIGSYGDPAAVPIRIWRRIARLSSGWTGYTHAWRRFPAYRSLLMASVESEADGLEARRRGWRTFRSRLPGEYVALGEIVCPASAEGAHRRTCAQCLACDGSARGARRASVSIVAHGSPAVMSSYSRLSNQFIQIAQNEVKYAN